MKIKKRDGRLEQLSFDKILYRLRKIQNDPSLGKLETIDADIIAQKVVSSMYDTISSSELDEEAARISVNMIENLEYPILASRLIISNMHKNTTECFSDVMEMLYNNVDDNENHAPILTEEFIEIVRGNKQLNYIIDYSRDYIFDYFGYKTLEKSYLLKINGKIIERPQHLYMRVAIQVHKNDIENVIKTYNLISQHYFTFASPTNFNSGTRLHQLSSCFLIGLEDSVDSIFKCITDVAKISKLGGGIGIHISNIRSKGAKIRGTNGQSDGIVPMLKVFNESAKYINQGSRRKGSYAIYLSPEHPDIFEFLDLKKNNGSEDLRARDLFYAMWIPDLFMKQVKENSDWYLMDPDVCPGLNDVYAEEYEQLYWKYVKEEKYKKKVKAQEIWTRILESQIETGTPYILYKDQCNLKSNQKNIGTIKSSNLCAEILLYSDDKEFSVCNLLSISLPKYVELNSEEKHHFNHQKLFEIAKHTVLPMNNVIDYNYYPTPETELSNKKHRPIGIGVQGYLSTLYKLKIPFESQEAKKLNIEIFETIYYGVLTGSIELAKKQGVYSTYHGSPFSQGKLQFDLWKEFNNINLEQYISGRWDWSLLKNNLKTFGIRNSTLTTLMPTAASAILLGNSESFEIPNSNIFKRQVKSGEFIVVNKFLQQDLTELNLWDKTMKDTIIAHNGSIQDIPNIPDNLKHLYKTVWEISMKSVIEQSADRAVFIDMTQSMNLFMKDPTFKKLSSMHFYAWSKHLKTGIYYLRSQSTYSNAKFSINPELEVSVRNEQKNKEEAILACSRDNPESCELCSA
jgi:ribonucleoside-diphosphate reductase alpha chain